MEDPEDNTAFNLLRKAETEGFDVGRDGGSAELNPYDRRSALGMAWERCRGNAVKMNFYTVSKDP